ncbi:uncharacterized protein E0L32_001195 [Thyridium curvatum]|uniref:Acid phosphatase n=1 Tax=Thyridium curvatum TaxID=1093900 RepID=A0A507AV58_9PEZI|nr:uncharacterized protein E0L32_001195 [Thyridium curvatum]TPX11377.1 hypothetical protein E0L32_001195 [Thyridium curvatum]
MTALAHILTLLTAAAAPVTALTPLYSTYTFNPLEHLAGVAPYFEPQDPPTSPDPPRGCSPARAAYLVRHAAIYANDYDYEEYIEPFLSKLENTTVDWAKIPSLDFLAGWKPPFSDKEVELLTRVGRLEAAQLGVSLSFRYPGLKTPSQVWTSSAERTLKSARALARAFAVDDDQPIDVSSIYESKEAGADSLTPYKSCPAYSSSAGSDQSDEYVQKFTAPIAARLNSLAPGGFNFTADDVYGMMELCGYETVVRGSSRFCDPDLFSPDEWLQWEYSADVQYHYNSGYGNPISGVVGLPWLNATAGLLLSSPQTNAASDDRKAQDLYISFTHRELPPMVLVAMGLFNNSEFDGALAEARINDTMPLDRINHRRAWKSSHVLPFLSNIAVERLDCTQSYGFDDGEYYRVLVNNAPQELPACGDGPGQSCSRQGFEEYLRTRAELFSGFSDKCGVKYDNSTDTLGIYSRSK